MIPTKEMMLRLSGAIQEDGLKEGEIRRIEGMGELYVALASTSVGLEYLYLYAITSEKGIRYAIYTKQEKQGEGGE